MIAEAALSLLWRHWKLILGAVVVLGLSVALTLTRGTLEREKAAHAKTKADYAFAQEVATVKAERQRRDLEDRYRRNADEAEDLHAAALASATDAAEQYIARNRVRPQAAQCPSSGTAPAASDQRPGVPEGVPAASVMVTADDVRACTGAVVYADEARKWALTLNPER
jgi:hypothetical protein